MSSDEAEKFWPIYNKYDDKIMALKEAQLKLRIQKRTGTDEEALKKYNELIKELKDKMEDALAELEDDNPIAILLDGSGIRKEAFRRGNSYF